MINELSNPEFWVGVGFCLVVLGLSFPVVKKMRIWAKGQSEIIKNELKEAHDLRVEAEALYQRYEAHAKNLDNEKALIMQEAEREVVALQKDADEKLSKKIERKKQDVQEFGKTINFLFLKIRNNILVEVGGF